MKLSPTTIYLNYQNNKYSLSKAIELLSILLENSCDLNFRLESLDILIKIASHLSKTYKILESCLISDENEKIRAKAVKYLFNFHYNKSFKILLWTIRNDSSFLVLRAINKKLREKDISPLYKEFQKRIENLSTILEINTNELDLILNCAKKLEDIQIIRKNSGNYSYLGNNAIIFAKDFSIHALSLTLFNRVPQSVFKLKKLEHLDLSYNFLKKLPYQIVNLRELKTLNLAANEINSFPLVLRLCNFKNILELNLSNNNIKKIPNWISELTYLKKLDLSNNYIKSFPYSIFRLKSLESLNISYNRIDNIPDELYEIESLRKITI